MGGGGRGFHSLPPAARSPRPAIIIPASYLPPRVLIPYPLQYLDAGLLAFHYVSNQADKSCDQEGVKGCYFHYEATKDATKDNPKPNHPTTDQVTGAVTPAGDGPCSGDPCINGYTRKSAYDPRLRPWWVPTP